MNKEQIYPTKPNTQETQQPGETLAQPSDLIEFARQYAPKNRESLRCGA